MITAKNILKNIKGDKKKEFEQRAEKFRDDYRELVKKYQCEIVPILHSGQRGIIPDLTIIDLKGQNNQSKSQKE